MLQASEVIPFKWRVNILTHDHCKIPWFYVHIIYLWIWKSRYQFFVVMVFFKWRVNIWTQWPLQGCLILCTYNLLVNLEIKILVFGCHGVFQGCHRPLVLQRDRWGQRLTPASRMIVTACTLWTRPVPITWFLVRCSLFFFWCSFGWIVFDVLLNDCVWERERERERETQADRQECMWKGVVVVEWSVIN